MFVFGFNGLVVKTNPARATRGAGQMLLDEIAAQFRAKHSASHNDRRAHVNAILKEFAEACLALNQEEMTLDTVETAYREMIEAVSAGQDALANLGRMREDLLAERENRQPDYLRAVGRV